MTITNYQVRRATVDDLVMLRRLWQQAQLNGAGLEKRLTEFQVVETPGGDVLGAVGLRIAEQQGEIHSEVFKAPAIAEELRQRLWERIQAIARNHGLYRLWISNSPSLFWIDHGFELAGDTLQGRRPAAFPEEASTKWLTLKLRDEPAQTGTLDAEFEVFRLQQREESERLAARARTLRWVAGATASVVLILVAVALACVYQHWHSVRPR